MTPCDPFIVRNGDHLLIVRRSAGGYDTLLSLTADQAAALGAQLTQAVPSPEPPTDSAPVTVTVTPDPASALGRLVGEPQEELTRVLGRLADGLAEVRARQGRDGARLALITGDFRDVTAAEMTALRDRLPPDLFPGVTVRFGDRGSVHVGTGGRP